MDFKEIVKKEIFKLLKKIKQIKKRSIYCVLVGIAFSLISILTNRNSIYVRENEIERSSYGTQKTPYSIKLDIENFVKGMEFNVSVSSRKYTKEEADETFLKKIEELKINMLNNNINYENINSKLNFATDLGDGIRANYTFTPKRIEDLYDKYKKKNNRRGISTKSNITVSVASNSDMNDFKYYVTYQGIIDGSGNIKNENFKTNEFCTGYIEIQLLTQIKDKEGSYKSEKIMIPVRIVSKELTPIESFKVAFKKEFDKNDKNTINENTIVLPKVVNDFKIKYREKHDFSFILLPIIGILVAVLMEAKEKENEKEKIKKRLRWLELDFSQIITKILLYVSSGMTIRNSMIRLAEQYQHTKSQNKVYETRTAYEELVIVKNKLNSGYSEINAYEEMAKNINMRSYTRFLNIIIQSIKNGNKDLKNILNMEVQDALYERKQYAKKLGEEAATKLVLPLMMMLSIIMIVIMVPAFMGM